jgi:Sec-independent protein translocase protein TatA
LNFLGIGVPEMGVIFLIAFLVLGPSRSIDMARTAGKVIRDLRRTFNDVAAAASLDLKEQFPPVRDSVPWEPAPPQDQDDPEDPEDQEKDKPSEASDE